IFSAQGALTLQEFVSMLSPHARHEAFPVFDGDRLLGAVTLWSVLRTAPDQWKKVRIRDLIDTRIGAVAPDCDVAEALRLLLGEHKQPMLLVVSEEGKIQG